MKFYRSNKKNKRIYEKINYTKLLLVITISFLVFMISFYYIGKKRDINNSIFEASIISILLGTGSIIGDLVENRNRIFVVDNNYIGYIDIHTEKVGGPYLKDEEFYELIDKHGIKEVFLNNHQFEGIDKGIIKSIISVKKKYNRIVLKAVVDSKEWRSSSLYTISKLYLKDILKKRKIIIPNDFDNYEELYKNIIKKKNM